MASRARCVSGSSKLVATPTALLTSEMTCMIKSPPSLGACRRVEAARGSEALADALAVAGALANHLAAPARARQAQSRAQRLVVSEQAAKSQEKEAAAEQREEHKRQRDAAVSDLMSTLHAQMTIIGMRGHTLCTRRGTCGCAR